MKAGNMIGIFLLILVVAGATFFIGKKFGKAELIATQNNFFKQLDSQKDNSPAPSLPIIVGTVGKIEGEYITLDLYGNNALPNPAYNVSVIDTKEIYLTESTVFVRLVEKEERKPEEKADPNIFPDAIFPFSEEPGSLADLKMGDGVSIQVNTDTKDNKLYAERISMYPSLPQNPYLK